MWRPVLRVLFVWALICSCVVAHGTALRLSAEPSHSLAGHIEVLIEPSARASIDDVLAGRAGQFAPLEGDFQSRFTRAAVWFRLSVRREAEDPGQWWLEFDNPLLEDIRVFQPNVSGQFTESRAGVNVSDPGSSQTLPVNLHLPVSGDRQVYVRIQSNTSLGTGFRLWQPEAYVREAIFRSRSWGLYFSIYVLLVPVYFGFWLTTRESVHGWYMLYLVLTLGLALEDRGWMQQLLPLDWRGYSNTLMRLSLCALIAVMANFNSSYLQMARRTPRFNRVYLGVAFTVTSLAAAAALGGYPQEAMKAVQPTGLLLILAAVLLSWRWSRRGDLPAGIFLWAFGVLYAGALLRFARNLGWFDFGMLSLHGYQIGSLIHMMVLSVGLFRGYARMRLEKEAAEAQVAAEQQQRQEQREFMAMISHEFRTPLSVIGASTDNLLRGDRLSEKDRSKCEKIQRANGRLMMLMDNYLSVERIESADSRLQKTPVNMVSLCAKVIEDFEGSPGPVIELRKEVDTLICNCDDGLIRIALRNLLQNARRHSRPDASVVVFVRERRRQILLSVLDSGDGISPDELPLIFKRYFRGRGAVSQPGAGLGLYLVDKIVQRHGGSVTVSSPAAGGCDFCIRLPKE